MSESSAEYQRHPRDGVEALVDRLRNLEREVGELKNNLLKQAGVGVEPDTLRVTGNLDVSGDLDVTGPAAFGNDVSIDDDLTVGGSGVVTGSLRSSNFVAGSTGWRLTSTGLEVNTLIAKDAIIGNQALASPVTAALATPARTSNWSANSTWSSKATTSISVPAGFSEALVIAVASVTATGSAIRYDSRASIDGNAGPEIQDLANTTGSSAVAHAHTVTGLSGGSISLAAQVWSTPSLAAHTGNIAVITGCAIFFR